MTEEKQLKMFVFGASKIKRDDKAGDFVKIPTKCMLGNFAYFLSSADFFSR